MSSPGIEVRRFAGWAFRLALVVALTAASAGARKPPMPHTVVELRAQAPKERSARRASLVAFARSDRPALAERSAALDDALALCDRSDERAARVELRLLKASLHDIDGRPARVTAALLAAAGDARAAKKLTRAQGLVALAEVDGSARRLLALLPIDAVFVEGAALSVPASWAQQLKAWRTARAKTSGPPSRGSSLALRMSLVDVSAGLSEALVDVHARRALVLRLQAIGTARGTRDGASLRAQALELRAALLLVDQDYHAAVLDLLRADRLRAQDPSKHVHDLPPPTWAKSLRTRALCTRVELEHGVRCDVLEQTQFGSLSFVDASLAEPHAFSADEANSILADYDVLLQRCVQAGAREKLTTQTTINLEWSIGNDGHVKSYDLRPLRLRGTSFDTCVHKAFALFRFARYPGEMQHMRLQFDVGGEL